MELNKLTPEEEEVIVKKGTEAPFSGKYNEHFESGIYVCRQCALPLYNSKDKFKSSCGWPSFDDELPAAVKRIADPDGMRTEITCARCNAHLGHVFRGERITPKNTRHCVNSISMEFVPKEKVESEVIILGGGCFWCTEAAFSIVPGVLSVDPGYAGGTVQNPTYQQISEGNSGHAEVVRVEYYPKAVSLEKILDVFFTVHDPTQLNRQGDDIGTQYRSVIFYTSKKQKTAVKGYIEKIKEDYERPLTTEVKKIDKFYKAEDYHVDYYRNNPEKGYCTFVISPKIKKLKKKLDLHA
ncbi:bifunctional methionine sulfoxide reductase B/A protein [Candidatus Micrarchaeota archaeon]|nr:bifunctional methionine sulfoxide reductase B/A protein [Candidatus Micrarchaeota archaeon]MBU1681894.1 bifunctional methionine sulfoxide reductase B/A protein [Candidatus Micrarchaeota archaeon]